MFKFTQRKWPVTRPDRLRDICFGELSDHSLKHLMCFVSGQSLVRIIQLHSIGKWCKEFQAVISLQTQKSISRIHTIIAGSGK